MSEWKEVKLGDICTELSDGLHKAPLFVEGGDYIFVNAKNLCDGVIVDNDPTKKTTHEEYLKYSKPLNENTILFSIDGTIGNIARYKGEKCVLGKGACYINPNPVLVDSSYIYFQLQSPHFNSYLNCMSTGSTIKHISLKTMRNYEFTLPPLSEQRSIASILSALDDKIAVNRRICENLEAQAQALFKHWFIDFAPFKNGKFVESELGMIPEGWRVGKLTEIAEYLNGLAMQKYPPISADDAIPVLKIKELGQSQCDNSSDKCSKRIKPEYIIKNGDVVFSWSGTLMVDIWCGGICGLNQHLFKVTSDNYPKWFYHMWTKHHLAEFIRIAKDKAVTMGHIKRGDLEKALVAIPDSDTLDKMSKVMEDIYNQIINTRLESNSLSTLRDTLLPKLMSGQIKVNEMEKSL